LGTHNLLNSIIQAISLQVHYYSEALRTQQRSADTVSEFHAVASQATASKGLA